MLTEAAGIDDLGADPGRQGRIRVWFGVNGEIAGPLVAMLARAGFAGTVENRVMGGDEADPLKRVVGHWPLGQKPSPLPAEALPGPRFAPPLHPVPAVSISGLS